MTNNLQFRYDKSTGLYEGVINENSTTCESIVKVSVYKETGKWIKSDRYRVRGMNDYSAIDTMENFIIEKYKDYDYIVAFVESQVGNEYIFFDKLIINT